MKLTEAHGLTAEATTEFFSGKKASIPSIQEAAKKINVEYSQLAAFPCEVIKAILDLKVRNGYHFQVSISSGGLFVSQNSDCGMYGSKVLDFSI